MLPHRLAELVGIPIARMGRSFLKRAIAILEANWRRMRKQRGRSYWQEGWLKDATTMREATVCPQHLPGSIGSIH